MRLAPFTLYLFVGLTLGLAGCSDEPALKPNPQLASALFQRGDGMPPRVFHVSCSPVKAAPFLDRRFLRYGCYVSLDGVGTKYVHLFPDDLARLSAPANVALESGFVFWVKRAHADRPITVYGSIAEPSALSVSDAADVVRQVISVASNSVLFDAGLDSESIANRDSWSSAAVASASAASAR